MKNFEQDFNEWLIKQPYAELNFGFPCIRVYNHYTEYNRFPDNMLFGLYVDFFDSVGIRIDIDVDPPERYEQGDRFDFYVYTKKSCSENENTFTTRSEARNAALEKAISIYSQ